MLGVLRETTSTVLSLPLVSPEHLPSANLPIVAALDWPVFPANIELLFTVCVAEIPLAVSSANVNWFSLHAFYRNRLIKTFLGASNTECSAES